VEIHLSGAALNPEEEQLRSDVPERRILLVDDEPDARQYLRRLIEAFGYQVMGAADSAEALALVRSEPHQLDLVVSDVMMPRLNGLELLHAMAAEIPELPCLLISGYTPPHLAGLGLVPPCGVLQKPLETVEFLTQVRQCLRPRT
jgi:two-component system cell cycle sensor histidine kinase/response regulator CckA